MQKTALVLACMACLGHGETSSRHIHVVYKASYCKNGGWLEGKATGGSYRPIYIGQTSPHGPYQFECMEMVKKYSKECKGATVDYSNTFYSAYCYCQKNQWFIDPQERGYENCLFPEVKEEYYQYEKRACAGRNELGRSGYSLLKCRDMCNSNPDCVSFEWRGGVVSGTCQRSTSCTEAHLSHYQGYSSYVKVTHSVPFVMKLSGELSNTTVEVAKPTNTSSPLKFEMSSADATQIFM
mmetsp:Transcript_43435/g.81565  ORF Transcript_43435/g.81565 Transcript_43435/m.81565 type:complete len:238 (+) Transcript_43435:78-791(+)